MTPRNGVGRDKRHYRRLGIESRSRIIRLVLQGHERTLKEPDRNLQLSSLGEPLPTSAEQVKRWFLQGDTDARRLDK